MSASSCPSPSGPAWTLLEFFDQQSVSPHTRRRIITKLQETSSLVAQGALKTSCAVSDTDAYYRKSINNIPFPVFQVGKKHNYAIVKVQLRFDLDKKGSLIEGFMKKIYIAVKLDFAGRSDTDLFYLPIYTWGKSRVDVNDVLKMRRIHDEPVFCSRLSGDQSVIYYGHCHYLIEGEKKNPRYLERVGILMEYCPVDFYHLFVNGRFLTISFLELYTHIESLLQFLVFLENNKVQHKDLKLENIMLDPTGRCKLIDYGLAKDLTGPLQFDAISGTPPYIPPEEHLAMNKKKDAPPLEVYSSKGDVFSMGVLLYNICFDVLPCQDGISFKVDDKYFNKMARNPSKIWEHYHSRLSYYVETFHKNAAFVPLIMGMMDFDVKNRFTPGQCLEVLSSIKQKWDLY